jgi:hypothetical protein
MRTAIPVDAIEDTIASAYAAAGLVPGGAPGLVVPLHDLVRAFPLVVTELPRLTRRSALAHIAAPSSQQRVPAVADEPLAGYLYANAAGGWIFADAADPLVRRRFTVAHELGHYLLHFLPLLQRPTVVADIVEFDDEVLAAADNSVDDPPLPGRLAIHQVDSWTASAAELERMENEANQFAGAVLMPAVRCTERVAELRRVSRDTREVYARRLASDFLVSRAAMLRRLGDLNLP